MFGTKNLSEKLMGRFFRRVDNVVWDLMTGRVGVHTREGIATLEGEGDGAQISVNLLEDFGMPIPAFAQSTPLDKVKQGDLIYKDRNPLGWVIGIKEPKAKAEDTDADAPDSPILKKFTLMKPDGASSTWTPPKVTMLGFESGVMVAKSLLDMLPGGNDSLNAMQGTMMPFLMMGGFDGDGGGEMMDKLVPMMLMSQMGVAAGGAGAGNMMQTMMMMQMMGGKSPFGAGGGSFFDK